MVTKNLSLKTGRYVKLIDELQNRPSVATARRQSKSGSPYFFGQGIGFAHSRAP
jgi:hypothetical protein